MPMYTWMTYFNDANEDTNVHVNDDVVTGHANVCRSVVMADTNDDDDDDNADYGAFDDTV